MSAAMHTREPWRTECWASHAPRSVVANLDPAEPTEVGGQIVLHLGRVHVAECEGSRREGGNEANAARIVACVNACAGISSAELERITDLAATLNHYETIKAQRDELLAALKNLHALVQGECPSLLESDHHDDMVRAAIAKVQP